MAAARNNARRDGRDLQKLDIHLDEPQLGAQLLAGFKGTAGDSFIQVQLMGLKKTLTG